MTSYLIEPSGVGKSTMATEAVHCMPHIPNYSLDQLCPHQQFVWGACFQALNLIEQAGHINAIVEIGAGTQTLEQLKAYLTRTVCQVILVYASPHEVLLRNPLGPERNPQEFKTTEYTNRKELYALADHTLDITGLSPKRAYALFFDILCRTFNHQ